MSSSGVGQSRKATTLYSFAVIGEYEGLTLIKSGVFIFGFPGQVLFPAPTTPLKASPARSVTDGGPACGEQASLRARRRLARFWERGGAHSAGGARRGKVAASFHAATAEPKRAAQGFTGIEARCLVVGAGWRGLSPGSLVSFCKP